MTFSLAAAAAEQPGRAALVLAGRTVSFGELAELALKARHELGDADPASPVPLVCHPRLAEFVSFFACLEAQLPVALLSPKLTEFERHERLVTISTLRTARAPGERRALAVVFTSGSAGAPKAVELSVAAFRASAEASAKNLGGYPDDRWLLALPFAHIGGLSILTRCLLARRPVVVPEPSPTQGFSPDLVIQAIERDRVTLVSFVPAQLALLLDRVPRWVPPPWLRAILLGGAAVSRALRDRAVDRGCPILASYGLTEACSQLTTQRPGSWSSEECSGPSASARRPAEPSSSFGLDCGEPLPGVELRIVEGAIEVRSPTLMTRYLSSDAPPSPIDAEGWLSTGDLGFLDLAGRLHVTGRADELIVTGGEKVAPLEVERLLESCPSVAAACVFGIPHPIWGSVVAAALVPRPGASVRIEELQALLAQRLSPAKRPRWLAILSELPAGGSGKVDRQAVASLSRPYLRSLRSV